jgi:hypothetical protein
MGGANSQFGTLRNLEISPPYRFFRSYKTRDLCHKIIYRYIYDHEISPCWTIGLEGVNWIKVG